MQSSHSENHTHKGTQEIKKVTIILTVLTIIELIIGFMMIDIHNPTTRLFLKGIICILMIVKAYYIVGFFMHLKHEINNFVMTIVIPLAIFFWFIVAFLYDGDSVKNLRNRYDRYYQTQSTTKVEKKVEHNTHNEKKVEEHK